MVLHKDSKWYQSWQNFKENNTYINSNSQLILIIIVLFTGFFGF